MIPLTSAREKFVDHLKQKGRAEATIIAYSKDIEQLVHYLKGKSKGQVHEVSKNDIEDFLTHLSDNDYTKKTISRKINAIKTFFKFLLDKGLIENDPALLVKHPKLEQSVPRILSKIEYRALRDTVKDDVRTKALVEILLQTGLRVSELASIKLSHIQYGKSEEEQGSLEVPGTNTIPGRTIPLNKIVQKAIQAYIEKRPKSDMDHLFVTKTGKPLLIRNIRATLSRYFKQIGLNDVTVNDLRHTFVAEHLKRGASVLLVSRIAGHKRLTTTENYLKHIDRQESGIGELEEL